MLKHQDASLPLSQAALLLLQKAQAQIPGGLSNRGVNACSDLQNN